MDPGPGHAPNYAATVQTAKRADADAAAIRKLEFFGFSVKFS